MQHISVLSVQSVVELLFAVVSLPQIALIAQMRELLVGVTMHCDCYR